MYTVWTRPSTAKGGRSSSSKALTATKKGVGGVMVPVITRSVLGSVAPVPLGSTISLTATAGPLLDMVDDLNSNKSSSSRRSSVTRKFGSTTYYEHAKHGSKSAASKQARALKKVGYKVKIT